MSMVSGLTAGQGQSVEKLQWWLPGDGFGDTAAVEEVLGFGLKRLCERGCEAGRVGGDRGGEVAESRNHGALRTGLPLSNP